MSEELTKQPTVEKPPVLSKKEKETLSKLGNEFLDTKKTELKEIAATKEWLFGRVERKYPITLKVEDTIRVFQARRLNETQRITMTSVQKRIGMIPVSEMTDEEYDLAQKQGYELLEVAIVEPALTKQEWEKVDLALVQELLEKINILQIEVNDGEAIDQLRNL